MSDTSFADKLSAACAFELSLAQNDHDRLGEMISHMTSSLAFTLAIGAKGDPKLLSALLEGVSDHLFEEASDKARFAKAMSR